jgi:hypothetical protein
MQSLYLRISAAVVVANAVACSTPPQPRESSPERISGCFRRLYGDPPPTATSGTVWYTLTTDAGDTRLLEVSPALLANAGGPTLLDRTRVSVILEPALDSAAARTRAVRVREIVREPAASGTAC